MKKLRGRRLERYLNNKYKARDAKFPGGYTIKEFFDLGFLEYAKARPNNLTNQIHPIMDLPKWQHEFSNAGRPPMTSEEESIMAPVLRLATALLLSPGSVSFLHSVMYGQRYFQPHLTRQHGEGLYVLQEPKTPNLQLRNEFTAGISQIIPHVRFNWGDVTSRAWANNQAVGVTFPSNRAKVDFMGTNGPQHGYASSIMIDDDYLSCLLLINQKRRTRRRINQRLRVELALAATICHELTHAINLASTTDKSIREPYYGDQVFNELGFAWEEAVFDSTINKTDDKYIWPLDLTRFPIPHYLKYAIPEEQDTPLCYPRGRPADSFMFYYISMKWISRLALQATWDRWTGSLNPKLLHVPRSAGSQRIYSRPLNPRPPEWTSNIPRKTKWVDGWDLNWTATDNEIHGDKEPRMIRLDYWSGQDETDEENSDQGSVENESHESASERGEEAEQGYTEEATSVADMAELVDETGNVLETYHVDEDENLEMSNGSPGGEHEPVDELGNVLETDPVDEDENMEVSSTLPGGGREIIDEFGRVLKIYYDEYGNVSESFYVDEDEDEDEDMGVSNRSSGGRRWGQGL